MARSLRRALVLALSLFAVLAAVTSSSLARTSGLSWQPSPTRFWRADGAAITSLFANGQCTMWALERRPGVVRRGVEAVVARDLADHRAEGMGDWDARYWPHNARLAHIATGRVARARALVVFQPGVLGAGATGHIAYVQRVYPDGSFLVSEMHAPTLWRVTHQRLRASVARRPGVTFIY